MAIKIPSVGEIVLLDAVRTNFLNSADIRVALFQANITPADGDTLATYSGDEADFDGYAEVAISGGWVAAVIVSGKAYTARAPVVWVPTGSVTPNDIYGFYVYDFGSGALIWAGRYAAAPIAVTGPATPVTYTPSFTFASES